MEPAESPLSGVRPDVFCRGAPQAKAVTPLRCVTALQNAGATFRNHHLFRLPNHYGW